jgi:hypothetical protein
MLSKYGKKAGDEMNGHESQDDGGKIGGYESQNKE